MFKQVERSIDFLSGFEFIKCGFIDQIKIEWQLFEKVSPSNASSIWNDLQDPFLLRSVMTSSWSNKFKPYFYLVWIDTRSWSKQANSLKWMVLLTKLWSLEHRTTWKTSTWPFRNTLTVFTGVSGSGIVVGIWHGFKEGQRRSLGLMPDSLGRRKNRGWNMWKGWAPPFRSIRKPSTVIVRQWGRWRDIRSLPPPLFPIGRTPLPNCGKPIESQTPEQIWLRLRWWTGRKLFDPCPDDSGTEGRYRKEIEQWAAEGYVRARIDGTIRRLDEDINSPVMRNIPWIGDRLSRIKERGKKPFYRSIEKHSDLLVWWFLNTGERIIFSASSWLALPARLLYRRWNPGFFLSRARRVPVLQRFGAVEHFHRRKALRPEIVHGWWHWSVSQNGEISPSPESMAASEWPHRQFHQPQDNWKNFRRTWTHPSW